MSRATPSVSGTSPIVAVRANRLAQAGVRMSRLRGRGNDFDRLREYRREDEYRNIDWKATARHQSLISTGITPQQQIVEIKLSYSDALPSKLHLPQRADVGNASADK
mgnify:CR=1 FL=1